jgi:hypothetical protein
LFFLKEEAALETASSLIAVGVMPIGRYFICIGSVLLALLFLADWYYPASAAVARAEVDRSILRIKSDHKWPERIVIDTTLPTIVPPPVLAEDTSRALVSKQVAAKVVRVLPAVSLPSLGRDLKPAAPRKLKLARRPMPNPFSFQQANARELPFGW